MSISAPPGEPSITETIAGSFRDAYALARTNTTPAVIALIIALIGAIAVVFTGWKPSSTFPVVLDTWLIPLYIVMTIVGYYSVAAAVRTLNPEYCMTVGQFFGFIGYGLLAGLLVGVAGIAFIIPAYWVGVKLLFTPYTYVVTNGESGALKRTWNMTTGYYWQTLGLILLTGLCLGVISYVAFGICMFAFALAPFSAIVLGPLALAVLIWAIHAQALIYVRWTDALLPRANTPQGVVPLTA